jgi:acetyltransferase-like isoleucine patch superfamily enzyme
MKLIRHARLRSILAKSISFLPSSSLRRFFYSALFGYSLRGTTLGFGTVINVDSFTAEGVRIGSFNQFTGPIKVAIRQKTSIGSHNIFDCGQWALLEETKDDIFERTLILGEECLITSYHRFDLCGRIEFGQKVWIAGAGTQFWTHGPRVKNRNIFLASHIYVGSSSLISPGVTIASHSMIAMGSVVTGTFQEEHTLIGGVPAKVLKREYDYTPSWVGESGVTTLPEDAEV